MSSSPIDLKIKAVIGFSGKATNSLSYTPCGQYIVYPLGSFVVIKSLLADRESFLDMHTYDVTCCKMTNDGTRVASGQGNIAGVKVMIQEYFSLLHFYIFYFQSALTVEVFTNNLSPH